MKDIFSHAWLENIYPAGAYIQDIVKLNQS